MGVCWRCSKPLYLTSESLLISFPRSPKGDRHAKRERALFSWAAGGRIGGLLSLWLSLWRREGGGISDLCLWPVYSRVGLPGGAERVVVAVALWNKGVVAGASSPSRRGPMGRSRQASDDLCSWIPRSKVLCCSWRVVCLGGDGEAAAVSSSSAFGPPASSPLRWSWLLRHREARGVMYRSFSSPGSSLAQGRRLAGGRSGAGQPSAASAAGSWLPPPNKTPLYIY